MTENSEPVADTALYWRDFVRSKDADIDTVADSEFLKLNSADRFGTILQNVDRTTFMTFNEVSMWFYNKKDEYRMEVYCVSDGAYIPTDIVRQKWYNPHVRLLTVLSDPAAPTAASSAWTIFVVGSAEINTRLRFLQVISWDGAKFTFYGRDPPPELPDSASNEDPKSVAWVHQGVSYDAFDEHKSYLGPFNGHVNGTTIMKELHQPWPHWDSNQQHLTNFPKATLKTLRTAKYLASDSESNDISVLGINEEPLGISFTGADILESTIKSTVQSWTLQRIKKDFFESDGKTLAKSPKNVSRWLAHTLLTTNVNVQCGMPQESGFTVPINFFINDETISQLPNSISVLGGTLRVSGKRYTDAATALGLCLLQEVDQKDFDELPMENRFKAYEGILGGGRQTNSHRQVLFAKTLAGEGNAPFTIIQPSYEDAQGTARAQGIKPKVQLMSDRLLNCLMMTDFCNPVYSWRRGVLMKYVPSDVTLQPDNTYSIECSSSKQGKPRVGCHCLPCSIIDSDYAKNDSTSPEAAFKAIFTNYDIGDISDQVQTYLKRVSQALSKGTGIQDYMKLAECRRRIYRPLPLNEFGFTLPFATAFSKGLGDGPDQLPYLEMAANGTVVPMPKRGQKFLEQWTGTLWGLDPQLLPTRIDEEDISVNSSISNGNNGGSADHNRLSGTAVNGISVAKASKRLVCPVMSAKMQPNGTRSLHAAPQQPTWNDDVQKLFVAPPWIVDSDGNYDEKRSKQIGSDWIGAMIYWGNKDYSKSKCDSSGNCESPTEIEFDMGQKSVVERHVRTIYGHIRSRSMPLTNNEDEYWPEWACETLRIWANQGFRVSSGDPFDFKERIPEPSDVPQVIRTRKDIRDLTEEELRTFRNKLYELLHVDQLNSKWQELCRLHGEWCLHYQEAFTFWHRAYLLYVEELIDFPIPYWNTLDPETAEPESEWAGLPQAFLDDSYVPDPAKPEESRKNPLKYALALDGDSKARNGSQWITRYQWVVDGRKHPRWSEKVLLFRTYQGQVKDALAQVTFSQPEDITTKKNWLPGKKASPFGRPWANLPAFTDHQCNKEYPFRADFDGLFEQAHDNGHGWIGPDMADNSFTGCDPIFLSYHANLDRVVSAFLQTHPTLQFTSNFPLRPFTGAEAKILDYDEPREYRFTTIGDMAKHTLALGYQYGLPACGDTDIVLAYLKEKKGTTEKPGAVPTGGLGLQVAVPPSEKTANGVPDYAAAEVEPYIVFGDIICTTKSYTVDVFAAGAEFLRPNHLENRDYIGRVTRIGMGEVSNKSRCRSSGVTRSLKIGDNELAQKVKSAGIVQVVKEISIGLDESDEADAQDGVVEEKSIEVHESEWRGWRGFTGTFVDCIRI